MLKQKVEIIKMVAGVRSVHSRRHDDEIVSLGTWRIEMFKAMKSYVNSSKTTTSNHITISVEDGKANASEA